MNRFTRETPDTLIYHFVIIFDDAGGIRQTRGDPDLTRGERAMTINLEVPKAIFRTPALRAFLTVADPGNPEPKIDLGVTAAALRAATGIDFDLRVIGEPEQ